ncbi:MAG: hypothetical protein KA764_19170 [Anaerolineales bacterium]|nr:hypothetical protein [Anaerolineales bacterium]
MRLLFGILSALALGVVLTAVGLSPAQAATTSQLLTIDPGSTLNVKCASRLKVTLSADRKSVVVTCAAVAAAPTATATALATATAPAPTATAVPPTATHVHVDPATATSLPATATSLPATATRVAPTATSLPPTATSVPPTATPPAGNGALPAVDPVSLGSCPASVHDRFVVTGPDGRLYRTWHAQTAPLDPANLSLGLCTFAHDHGDDPRTSLANAALPPFGYVGALAGHDEAHEGFKVFVANVGDVNDEGRVALGSSRIVFHMGTGGVKRYTMPHHSVLVDLVMPTGQYVHVQGMFDTARAGSICDRDRSLNDGNPANDVGRTVVTLPGTGCDLGSLYEIWSGSMAIRRPDGSIAANVGSTVAVFDPITVMDPNDTTRLIYSADAFRNRRNEAPFMGTFDGCDREAYHSGAYWYNRQGATVYYTDAFGNPGGPLRQEISQHEQIGVDMSQRADGNLNAFKYRKNHCSTGIGPKN